MKARCWTTRPAHAAPAPSLQTISGELEASDGPVRCSEQRRIARSAILSASRCHLARPASSPSPVSIARNPARATATSHLCDRSRLDNSRPKTARSSRQRHATFSAPRRSDIRPVAADAITRAEGPGTDREPHRQPLPISPMRLHKGRPFAAQRTPSGEPAEERDHATASIASPAVAKSFSGPPADPRWSAKEPCFPGLGVDKTRLFRLSGGAA